MWLAFKLGVQYKFNRVTSAKLKICKVFSFVYVSSKNCSIWTDWIVSLCWICFYCPQGWSGWMHSSNQQLTAWPHELSTYFIVEFVLYCYIQGWPGWKHSSNQKPAVWPHEYSKYFNVEFVFFCYHQGWPGWKHSSNQKPAVWPHEYYKAQDVKGMTCITWETLEQINVLKHFSKYFCFFISILLVDLA